GPPPGTISVRPSAGSADRAAMARAHSVESPRRAPPTLTTVSIITSRGGSRTSQEKRHRRRGGAAGGGWAEEVGQVDDPQPGAPAGGVGDEVAEPGDHGDIETWMALADAGVGGRG